MGRTGIDDRGRGFLDALPLRRAYAVTLFRFSSVNCDACSFFLGKCLWQIYRPLFGKDYRLYTEDFDRWLLQPSEDLYAILDDIFANKVK